MKAPSRPACVLLPARYAREPRYASSCPRRSTEQQYARIPATTPVARHAQHMVEKKKCRPPRRRLPSFAAAALRENVVEMDKRAVTPEKCRLSYAQTTSFPPPFLLCRRDRDILVQAAGATRALECPQGRRKEEIGVQEAKRREGRTGEGEGEKRLSNASTPAAAVASPSRRNAKTPPPMAPHFFRLRAALPPSAKRRRMLKRSCPVEPAIRPAYRSARSPAGGRKMVAQRNITVPHSALRR